MMKVLVVKVQHQWVWLMGVAYCTRKTLASKLELGCSNIVVRTTTTNQKKLD